MVTPAKRKQAEVSVNSLSKLKIDDVGFFSFASW